VISAEDPFATMLTAALILAQVTAGGVEQFVEARVAVSVVFSPIEMDAGLGVTVTLWTAHDGSVPPPHAARTTTIPSTAAGSQRFAL
jgi:hypothetical protein